MPSEAEETLLDVTASTQVASQNEVKQFLHSTGSTIAKTQGAALFVRSIAIAADQKLNEHARTRSQHQPHNQDDARKANRPNSRSNHNYSKHNTTSHQTK